MRVVVAPDKFKDTLSAEQAARAMAAGWRREDPGAEVDEVPVADGGEGTLDALVSALDGRRERVRVSGPLGDPVEAEYGLAYSPEGLIAVVEMATASGLALVSPERRDPLRASTFGTGQLILAATRRGPKRVIVCIGGSATTDGGAGMAQAVGIRLLDEEGRDLRPGGGALRRLARIDAGGLAPELREIDLVVATDVDNPLTGPRGAASVFGPQKGAGPEQVAILEEGLRHCAATIHRDLGIDVRDVPGSGAAGGLGGGLIAFLGARSRGGFDIVSEVLDLPRRLEGADVAVTGEGLFDIQTSGGKAPAGVLRLAREAGCNSVVIAGQIEAGVEPEADLIYSLTERAGSVEVAMRDAARLLQEATEDAAGKLAP
ncbi:MAG: glycerate kinase [Actinomycetota bacterium]